MPTIRVNLDNIEDARRYLREYAAKLDGRLNRLTTALAEIGVAEANLRFMGAFYEGDRAVSVYTVRETGKVLIVAEGEAVAFIEFGAGVFYNSDGTYPLKRPAGISRIGEYGLGHGKRPAWGYYDDNKQLKITRGTPAAMPMYWATKTMKQKIVSIAKEVFADG